MFAYVMLQTKLGKQTSVMEKLCEIEQVSEHYAVYGLFDILLKVQCHDNMELEKVLARHLEMTPDIKSTKLLKIKK